MTPLWWQLYHKRRGPRLLRRLYRAEWVRLAQRIVNLLAGR